MRDGPEIRLRCAVSTRLRVLWRRAYRRRRSTYSGRQRLARGLSPAPSKSGDTSLPPDQKRTPVQSDQCIGASRDHLPRNGEQSGLSPSDCQAARYNSCRTCWSSVFGYFAFHSSSSASRFCGTPSARMLSTRSYSSWWVQARGSAKRRDRQSGQAGGDRAQRHEMLVTLHGFCTVTTFLDRAVTSTSCRFTILPSCMVRISYLPTGTRTVAGTCGATCRPS